MFINYAKSIFFYSNFIMCCFGLNYKIMKKNQHMSKLNNTMNDLHAYCVQTQSVHDAFNLLSECAFVNVQWYSLEKILYCANACMNIVSVNYVCMYFHNDENKVHRQGQTYYIQTVHSMVKLPCYGFLVFTFFSKRYACYKRVKGTQRIC